MWRVHLVYFFMALLAITIVLKVLHIQFVEGEHWAELARSATVRYQDIEAARGDIYDQGGQLLATSLPVYEIRMDTSRDVIPDEVFRQDLDSLALALSMLFQDRSPARYRSELNQARARQDRYFLVKRNVSYHELIQLRQFPIFRLGRFRGGLIIEERSRREMPYKRLAARTIGYEREGVYVGLEGAYRHYLEGTDGKRLVQRISGGHWMPISDENEIRPENGMDVITTLHTRIQDITHHALEKSLQRFRADHGTAVVMEVSTGKIRAISNLSLSDRGTYEESYNHAVGESTEPGSTFKLASMIAILEAGVARPGDTLHTGDGSIRYANHTMRDVREGGHGSITLQEAFAYSSNVGLSMAVVEGFKDKPQAFVDHLRAMRLDQPLGLEISGEGRPQIKDANDPAWSAVSLPWMAIGYEVSITPLQILSLYNAVANNGRMMKPMFVEEIRHTGRTIQQFRPTVLQRSIASSSTIRSLRDMLADVVEYGTGSNIRNPHYAIAGKTGTAQVAQTGGTGYRSAGRATYRASFAGYFPADNPRYSIIVVVHGPKGWIYTGSQVAAPVFREIADKIFAMEMAMPDSLLPRYAGARLPAFRAAHVDDLREIYATLDRRFRPTGGQTWVSAGLRDDTLRISEKNWIENLVPEVTGMSLRDALYVLENAGMRVRFNGQGTVRRQSPGPGNRINPGGVIYLELR